MSTDAQDWIDKDGLLARVGGDLGLLREVVDLFEEDHPQCMAAIRRGCEEDDAEAVSRAAHRIKGTVANLGGRGAYTVARALEVSAKAGDLSKATDLLAHLQMEVDRLAPALRDMGRGA